MAQCAVWPFGVVVFSALLDQDLCLTEAVEDFPVQQLVAEAGVSEFCSDNARPSCR